MLALVPVVVLVAILVMVLVAASVLEVAGSVEVMLGSLTRTAPSPPVVSVLVLLSFRLLGLFTP